MIYNECHCNFCHYYHNISLKVVPKMIKHQVCQKSSKAINKSFDDWRVFKLCSTTTPSSVGYFIEYFFVFEQCVCWLRKLSTHSIGIVFVYFVRPAEVVLKKCKKKPLFARIIRQMPVQDSRDFCIVFELTRFSN